jgi:formylmethanofuran dehydrogenase subunit E
MTRIRSYTFEEFVQRTEAFHGFAAPGVIIGGFMVDLAYRHLPKEGLFDALCETPKCLPDAIQLLTPCTVGNGWLTVINLGRYALTMYDKLTGHGVRVSVDAKKIEEWPLIKGWYFKLTQKADRDERSLLDEIDKAGAGICSVRRVCVADRIARKTHRGAFAVCPTCGEAFPAVDGEVCLGCRGEPLFTPYP